MKTLLNLCAFVFLRGLLLGQADTVLVNGKILTVDKDFSIKDSIAIKDGRILAVGNARSLAGPATQLIDLEGRTVIPGLIDSHLHAIRAALSFATEVNWIGSKSLTEALGRMHEASRTHKTGSWLIVAGGWNVQQFKEKRRPTMAELEAAAPDNPAYVQLGYGWAVMNSRALQTLGIKSEDGTVSGGQDKIIALFDRLPQPTYAQQVEGTRKFFTELNRLGITGVVDPGGNNLAPEDYRAVFEVWRAHELTVRIAYALCGQAPGSEFEDFKNLTKLLPMGFGDDMLRFNGLGERITAAMNNNDKPTETDQEKYSQIVKWAAERGMAITMHWNRNASVGQLLTIFENVNKEIPIAPLRWSIAHLNDASEENLRRMKALNIGWTVQDAMYFANEGRMPPVVTAAKLGVAIGAGTDAHRVASYNPFTALQWFQEARTVGGTALGGREEIPSRAEALRLYTLGSAWFSKDEDKRGSLEPGKLADLAVLSKDYMTVPVDQIGEIESVMTMVGGKIVYRNK